jgi:hypothetical protein
MATEDERLGGDLKVTREPKGPKRTGDRGTVGDQALMDALIIVLVAWAVIFFLAFSLRRHNI